MKNFETLLLKVGKQYLLTEEDLQQAVPPSSQPGIDQVENNPQPEEAPEETEKLTSEGKKFLIELALKALAVGPDQISEQDKSIFSTEVTVHNADEILSRIQTIVDQASI